MRAYDFQECTLLEGFAGPADALLPADTLEGLEEQVTPRWWQHTPCATADPDAWFPDPFARVGTQVARVCGSCPVRESCLVTAVLDDEHGIWGGTRRGQRLHARARMLNGDPPAEVLAELLCAPMPRTEYTVPDPVPDPADEPVAAVTGDDQLWREAS